jgi:hypothetical protein
MNSTEARVMYADLAIQTAVFLRVTVMTLYGLEPACWPVVCYAAGCSLNFFYHRSKADGLRRIDRINLNMLRSGGDRTGLEAVEDMKLEGASVRTELTGGDFS